MSSEILELLSHATEYHISERKTDEELLREIQLYKASEVQRSRMNVFGRALSYALSVNSTISPNQYVSHLDELSRREKKDKCL